MIQYVDKNKYKVTVECGFINNKRKRISRICYGTKREAKILELELINQTKQKNINFKKLKLNELINIFLNDYCYNSIKENTLYGYKSLIKIINRELGEIYVNNLNPYILQKFYNNLETRYNYSSNTIAHYYVLINNILEKGCKWKIINDNPNKDINKPKIIKKETCIYDYEQVSKLLKALENEPIKNKTPIILCLDSGMRREELNGLMWKDINFNTNEISINQVRIAVGNKIITTDPKTIKSKRKIIVSNVSIELLKELKEYQDNIAKKLKNKWKNSGYVFVNDFGEQYYPDRLSKIFKNIQKKYNLPIITFHGLRHTSVSLLINSKEDITSISTRVGHSNVSTTLNMYSHLLEKSKKDIANKMNTILKNC